MEEKSFLSGDNAEESFHNFYEWTDQVFDGCGLPCTSKVKNSHGTGRINGYCQHLSDTEATLLFQTLSTKWELWQCETIESGLSAGALVRTSPSERGFCP